MNLDEALHEAAAFSVGDRLEGLKQHLNAAWIEEALAASGTVSLRRRRLPADQVVWMVVGMGLIRNQPIEKVAGVLFLGWRSGRIERHFQIDSIGRLVDQLAEGLTRGGRDVGAWRKRNGGN